MARREHLHLDGSIEAGGFDELADASVVDAALAHEAAVFEQVGGGGHPVADVESADAFARARDFRLQLRVPPDMVDIGGDADPFLAQLVDHVVALADGVDRAAAVGVHGVERLNGELDAGGAGVVDAGGDARGDLFPVLGQGQLREGATDEYDLGCADRCGLVEGLAVVVERGLPAGVVGAGKEASAHEGDGLQPVVVEQLAGLGQWSALEPLAPEPDPRHPGGGVLGAGRGQIPGLGCHGVDGETGKGVHCSVLGYQFSVVI